MRNYDLCLTWNWEYDADFVKLLNLACQSHQLSLLQITPENLLDRMQSITNKEIVFQIFFDRASDTDGRFIPLVQWACNHVVHHINFHKLASRAWDKVAMHQVISIRMNTPLTLPLPSYNEQPFLPEIDLSSLGESFTIKPAYGGGGDGVINEATTLNQVLIARQEFPNQRYLLQGYIIPARLGSRRAWFRVIYCAGKVLVKRLAITLVRYVASLPQSPTSVDLHCSLLKLPLLLMAVLSLSITSMIRLIYVCNQKHSTVYLTILSRI